MVETITPPTIGTFNFDVQITAEIKITAERAMRSVGVYTGNYLSDLLHGNRPNLVFCDQGTYWRVPVALSSRSQGYIGTVGEIDVDVETGELNIQANNIKEIKRNAKRLAASAAL